MIRRSRQLAVLLAPLTVGLVAPARGAEAPRVRESLEVRVVNVEAVVTDRDGRAVPGLGVEDFELRLDDQPVAIDYFRAVTPAPGGPAGEATAEAAADSARDESRPYLVVVLDGRSLDPGRVREALAELERELDRVLAAARGVLVARIGRSLAIEQAMTRDRRLLSDALSRLRADRLPPVDISARTQLMRQIEGADSEESATLLTDDPELNLRVEAQANSLLREIRAQAASERAQSEAAARQLETLVRSIGGLPGRKAVLYVGAGFHSRPVESVYRLWWSKYRRIAHRLEVRTIESEITAGEVSAPLGALVEAANADRIAFFTHDPGGLQLGSISAEFGSVEATQALAAESMGRQRTVASLAAGTGGLGQLHGNRLTDLLDPMLTGFGAYYSLGFDPAAAPGAAGRLEVRVPGTDYRIRHFDRYTTHPLHRRLDEQALSTLLTGVDDNPLGASLEIGEPEAQGDGTYLLPLLVKIPLAQLSLLPEADHHVGRLSVVILARGRDGSLSSPASGEVPVTIPNADLLAALSSRIGYRMRMRVAAGEQRIVIGLRDEIAGRDTTVHVALDPTVRRDS